MANRNRSSEGGAKIVEYILLAGVIALLAVLALTLVGQRLHLRSLEAPPDSAPR